MKTILVLTVGLMLAGCGSVENEVRNHGVAPTSRSAVPDPGNTIAVDTICACPWWLKSDALPFGRFKYAEPNAISNAIDYAKHRSRSHRAVIRVYDAAGNMIETHENTGDFKEG